MTTSDHSFLAIARCFSRTKLDFGSKFLLCTQFGLFSVLYFALRIASVRILGAGRMLESKAVIMIDAKMIETQMVADARCAKTCWGLQPGPAPGPGLVGYHLCPVTVWRILKCNYVLLRDVCGTWSSFCLHLSSIHFES